MAFSYLIALIIEFDKCYFLSVQTLPLKAMLVKIHPFSLNVLNYTYRRRQKLKCQPKSWIYPPQL